MGKRIFIFLAIALTVAGRPIPAGYTEHTLTETQKQGIFAVANAEEPQKEARRTVWVTAYSSTPEETDDTPFVTASMTEVRDGIIAANFLPFGTRVIIPDLFGDKVFTVEDRMHRRKTNFVDIWMPTKQDALEFGINRAEVVILNES